ncbi:unnamed protein product [Pseudo-nitzschia multistriata]|uniref:Uncharacterized protein n=1 Tax=Pseudo-nitzschia multistriata TaxID=183589 RepID=A0A448ZI43_9STRA|nr:unnamed protein product [Pseudo-nitzschia multistriata]
MVRIKIKKKGKKDEPHRTGNFLYRNTTNRITAKRCHLVGESSPVKRVHANHLLSKRLSVETCVSPSQEALEPRIASLNDRNNFVVGVLSSHTAPNIVPSDETDTFATGDVNKGSPDSLSNVRLKLLSVMDKVVDHGNMVFGNMGVVLSSCEEEDLKRRQCDLMERLDKLFERHQRFIEDRNPQDIPIYDDVPSDSFLHILHHQQTEDVSQQYTETKEELDFQYLENLFQL